MVREIIVFMYDVFVVGIKLVQKVFFPFCWVGVMSLINKKELEMGIKMIHRGVVSIFISSFLFLGCNSKDSNSNQLASVSNYQQNVPKVLKKIKKMADLSPLELSVHLFPNQTISHNTDNSLKYQIDGDYIEFNPNIFLNEYGLGGEGEDSIFEKIQNLDKELNEKYDFCRQELSKQFNGDFQSENQFFIDCVREKGINENTQNYIEIKKYSGATSI